MVSWDYYESNQDVDLPLHSVVDLFPPELREHLDRGGNGESNKKRKVLSVSKVTAVSYLDRMLNQEQERSKEAEARGDEDDDDVDEDEEVDEDEDKPDAVDDEDNWSAASSDSEEADDDYNAEQYFDNGEDDDIDDADPYENTYE